MTSIKIPKTIDEAVTALGPIEALLASKEWERAAIVATFVRVRGYEGDSNLSLLTPDQFATKYDLPGLQSENTVRRYAIAWLSRFPRPVPGWTAELPDEDFPPGTRTKVKDIAHNSRAVAEAADDPAFVQKVLSKMKPGARRALALAAVDEQILDDPDAKQSIRHKIVEHDAIQAKAAQELVEDEVSEARSLEKALAAHTVDGRLLESRQALYDFQRKVTNGHRMTDREVEILTEVASTATDIAFNAKMGVMK